MKEETEKDKISRKIDDLSNVIHVLEATANAYYSPGDRMWKILLRSRNNIRYDIGVEIGKLYKRIKEIDNQ